jgi:hypothetical protein
MLKSLNTCLEFSSAIILLVNLILPALHASVNFRIATVTPVGLNFGALIDGVPSITPPLELKPGSLNIIATAVR